MKLEEKLEEELSKRRKVYYKDLYKKFNRAYLKKLLLQKEKEGKIKIYPKRDKNDLKFIVCIEWLEDKNSFSEEDERKINKLLKEMNKLPQEEQNTYFEDILSLLQKNIRNMIFLQKLLSHRKNLPDHIYQRIVNISYRHVQNFLEEQPFNFEIYRRGFIRVLTSIIRREKYFNQICFLILDFLLLISPKKCKREFFYLLKNKNPDPQMKNLNRYCILAEKLIKEGLLYREELIKLEKSIKDESRKKIIRNIIEGISTEKVE